MKVRVHKRKGGKWGITLALTFDRRCDARRAARIVRNVTKLADGPFLTPSDAIVEALDEGSDAIRDEVVAISIHREDE